VVTIGDGMEKEASAFMAKKEPLYGYLLDRIGSLAVESLAEIFEEKLRGRQHASKRSCSMRLSPGYCDWPIEEQVIMAKALDFPKAGIRLTKKCMMIPRKSISAMVAMGPKGLFEKGRPQCLACDREDCDYRRVSQATD
jgi:cobalamin-dependent methionine synthase I